MERIYRGYPLGTKKEPWMLYRKEEKKTEPKSAWRKLYAETEDLRSFYPAAVKKLQILAEEACDSLDYPESPMYDDYPDRVFLYRNLSKIGDSHPEIGKEKSEMDLLQVLFVNELYRRRIIRRTGG